MSGAFSSGHARRFGEPEWHIEPNAGCATRQTPRFLRETFA